MLINLTTLLINEEIFSGLSPYMYFDEAKEKAQVFRKK